MKKVLTIILDGFSIREEVYGNAVKNAGMSHFTNIWNKYPHSLLSTSEGVIDLSKRQSIDSTFGHKIIGAGRPIKTQFNDLLDHFKKNDFINNTKYQEMINYLKQTRKRLHLIMMLSDGGTTSHIDILKLFIKQLKISNVENEIYLHIISDGRDSSSKSLKNYIRDLDIRNLPLTVRISTLCGRFYALDDTGNYNRTKIYYDLLYNIDGIETGNIDNMIDLCYQKNINDDYIPPIKMPNYVSINEGDTVLFLNYSKFNQQQLLETMTKKNNVAIYSLYEINEKLNNNYFFREEIIENSLCKYIGELGITSAKIFEKIKKPNMTYYLDGCQNVKIDNCDIYEVATPRMKKNDEHPELGALSITKTIIKCMEQDYDFIIANYANSDILGHTGNYQAVVNGLQVIDICLGKIIEVAEENFYKVIILGSHANVDTIIDSKNNIINKDTRSAVPLIIMDNKLKLKNGNLSDVAPTILKYLDISIPKDMKQNKTLIEEN